MTRAPRFAFTPEALSTFEQTMDEVWKELRADDSISPLRRDARQLRTKLARKLIAFASSGWSPVQIKQLLLRALRNERRKASGLAPVGTAGANAAPSHSRQDAAERT